MKNLISRLFSYCVRIALVICYAPIKLLPTQNKITIISRQQDVPSLDLRMLADAYQEEFPSWDVTVLAYEFHTSFAKKLGYIGHVFTQMTQIARSRLVVVDTYCIPVSVLKHKKTLKVVQIWHALGSLKRFGYSILDIGEGSSSATARIMKMHGNYDAVLTSSAASAPAFAEAFNVDESIMKVIPLPRVDALRDHERMSSLRAKIVAAHPELGGGKSVLFAPTFQKGQTFAADELHKYFARHGYALIPKPHPVALTGPDTSAQQYSDFSAFDYLAVADYVVTDYSSILLEAGVADIPIFILAPDMEKYSKTRSFYIDFEGEVPSKIASSFDQLLDNLNAFDGDKSPLRAFTDRYVEVPAQGTCTEAIMKLSRELIEVH